MDGAYYEYQGYYGKIPSKGVDTHEAIYPENP